jgi:hypothetical protein
MSQPGQKNLSAFIEPKIAELFQKHCENNGHIKYRAIEAAIRCWLALPTEVQSNLMQLKGDEIIPVAKIFEFIDLKLFRDRVQAAVDDLGLSLRKSKVSRKISG